MHHPYRRLAFVAAVVSLSALAGCGSSDEAPAAPKPLDPNDPLFQKIDPKKPPKLPSGAGQQPPRY